jgi:hypothetical protein
LDRVAVLLFLCMSARKIAEDGKTGKNDEAIESLKEEG